MQNIEIVTIGDELVEGRLTDTNSGWMSQQLLEAGFVVTRHTSVGDELDLMIAALQESAARSAAVLVSGGLGPTTDDLTADAAAKAFGRKTELVPFALEHVKRAFRMMGRTMTPNNEKQAWLPEGCGLIENRRGTATGFTLDVRHSRLYFMPGVPKELYGMFQGFVLPDLRERLSPGMVRVSGLKLMGLGESKVGDLLESLTPPSPGALTIQYRAAMPEVHVRLCLRGYERWESAGDDVLAELTEEALRRLGPSVYTQGDETLAQTIMELLRRREETVATAESCTGGLASAELTSVAGSSVAFMGGVVSYANDVKVQLLGVSDGLLAEHGAVSEPVAAAMASGVRARLGTTYGVATTGIAGPGGGTEEKPVGTVYIALATPDEVTVRKLFFAGDRERIRRYTASSALDLLRRYLQGVLHLT
ncbi:MAG: competence/damage-inducible protein A [Myxococcota bacterium]